LRISHQSYKNGVTDRGELKHMNMVWTGGYENVSFRTKDKQNSFKHMQSNNALTL